MSNLHLVRNREQGHAGFMKTILSTLIRDERGQDLIEYTLLMAFITLASAAIFANAGVSATGIWKTGSNTLSNAAVAGS